MSISICKRYIYNICIDNRCRLLHIDNICRKHFFESCNDTSCNFLHNFKFYDEITNDDILNNKYDNIVISNINQIKQNIIDKNQQYTDNEKCLCKRNNKYNRKIKNTETFVPDFNEPDIKLKLNCPLTQNNQICIINLLNLDNIKNKYHENIIEQLLSEIPDSVYKEWHGNSHIIADDNIDWRSNSKTFNQIVDRLCEFFYMTPNATRLNIYNDNYDWKPYHHDAAAIKPHIAKLQNITVGVSFGSTREISFQHSTNKTTINIPLDNGIVYAFGNKINRDFKHGIPQVKSKEVKKRVSIIVWGLTTLISDHTNS